MPGSSHESDVTPKPSLILIMNMKACLSFSRTAAMLACAMICATGASHADTAAPKLVTTVEGISEYRLDNGLRFLLFPDNSQSKVTVNLTALVGSRQEGYGETGMAHLLEHMLFKGTPRHPHIPKV